MLVARLWDGGKALGQALRVPLQLPMASFCSALNLQSRFFRVPSQPVPGRVAAGSVSPRCADGITGTGGLSLTGPPGFFGRAALPPAAGGCAAPCPASLGDPRCSWQSCEAPLGSPTPRACSEEGDTEGRGGLCDPPVAARRAWGLAAPPRPVPLCSGLSLQSTRACIHRRLLRPFFHFQGLRGVQMQRFGAFPAVAESGRCFHGRAASAWGCCCPRGCPLLAPSGQGHGDGHKRGSRSSCGTGGP